MQKKKAPVLNSTEINPRDSVSGNDATPSLEGGIQTKALTNEFPSRARFSLAAVLILVALLAVVAQVVPGQQITSLIQYRLVLIFALFSITSAIGVIFAPSTAWIGGRVPQLTVAVGGAAAIFLVTISIVCRIMPEAAIVDDLKRTERIRQLEAQSHASAGLIRDLQHDKATLTGVVEGITRTSARTSGLMADSGWKPYDDWTSQLGSVKQIIDMCPQYHQMQLLKATLLRCQRSGVPLNAAQVNTTWLYIGDQIVIKLQRFTGRCNSSPYQQYICAAGTTPGHAVSSCMLARNTNGTPDFFVGGEGRWQDIFGTEVDCLVVASFDDFYTQGDWILLDSNKLNGGQPFDQKIAVFATRRIANPQVASTTATTSTSPESPPQIWLRPQQASRLGTHDYLCTELGRWLTHLDDIADGKPGNSKEAVAFFKQLREKISKQLQSKVLFAQLIAAERFPGGFQFTSTGVKHPIVAAFERAEIAGSYPVPPVP